MYVKFAVNTLHCKLSDGIVVSHYNGEPWRSGSRGGWACLQKNSQSIFIQALTYSHKILNLV